MIDCDVISNLLYSNREKCQKWGSTNKYLRILWLEFARNEEVLKRIGAKRNCC